MTESIKQIEGEIIALRRQLHQIPEAGFREFETSKLIAGYLESLGLEVQTQVAQTGVVGILRGAREGKTLLIRADMDALPIQEMSSHSYVSRNAGMMHACGHDIHMAIALGTAKLLSQHKETLEGNIKFVFQPAEEALGGAEPMIAQGVMHNPGVDGAVALHIWDLPLNTVGLRVGSVTASTDFFDIKLTGRGGHGAKPELCVNPITAAAELVRAINSIKAQQHFVASVCSISGGEGENTIPDTCRIKGTVRTLDEQTRQLLHDEIAVIAEKCARDIGAAASVNYRFLYPPTINERSMTELFATTARRVLGGSGVIWQDRADMTGEDFSFFARLVPSCYIRLGGASAPLHTDKFDADERCISSGMALLCDFAKSFLGETSI